MEVDTGRFKVKIAKSPISFVFHFSDLLSASHSPARKWHHQIFPARNPSNPDRRYNDGPGFRENSYNPSRET